MSDYGSQAGVEKLCRMVLKPAGGVFLTTTPVTIADVAEFLTDHSGEVSVALSSQGYVGVVTEPAAFVAWLDALVCYGTAAAVLKSWFQDPSGPQSEAAWAVWERRYRDGLKAIRDGTMIPSEVDEATAALPGGNDADPVFEIEKVF